MATGQLISLWTELGDIVDSLNCVVISLHSHLSSWLPGFLRLVEGEDGVELR